MWLILVSVLAYAMLICFAAPFANQNDSMFDPKRRFRTELSTPAFLYRCFTSERPTIRASVSSITPKEMIFEIIQPLFSQPFMVECLLVSRQVCKTLRKHADGRISQIIEEAVASGNCDDLFAITDHHPFALKKVLVDLLRGADWGAAFNTADIAVRYRRELQRLLRNLSTRASYNLLGSIMGDCLNKHQIGAVWAAVVVVNNKKRYEEYLPEQPIAEYLIGLAVSAAPIVYSIYILMRKNAFSESLDSLMLFWIFFIPIYKIIAAFYPFVITKLLDELAIPHLIA